MICYRDMTFCSSDCTNAECPQHWDDAKQAAADKWWGKPGAPVAFADFSHACDRYVPSKAEE